jgi:hypothetical protein
MEKIKSLIDSGRRSGWAADSRGFPGNTIAGRLYRAGAVDRGNASAGGVNPEMRDPTGDRERRRRKNTRFVLTFGGLILAALVISILVAALAIVAADLRVFG